MLVSLFVCNLLLTEVDGIFRVDWVMSFMEYDFYGI